MRYPTWLNSSIGALAAVLALGIGCGDDGDGSSGSSTSDGTGGTSTSGSTSTTGTGTGTGESSTSTGEPGTSTGEPGTSTGEPGTSTGTSTGAQLCAAEIEALAPDVTEALGGCSVIVRLDHDTLDLIGYQTICSPYVDNFLDEQGARDLTDCCAAGGTRLNAGDDENLWVFYVPPGDFGDVAVVTNHIVQRLFEATIIWLGTGEISFPAAWSDPAALGTECGEAQMPDVVSYDLVVGSGPVEAGTIDDVWDVVGSTALPFAMETLGQLHRAAVLRYPRSVGAFDPSTAEYVVILEGGV